VSTAEHENLISMARLYETAQRAYSAIPYHFFKGGYSFPAWHYYFEVTRRCNLRCRMCQYIEWLENMPATQQKEGELTTEEWHHVIDQAGRLSFITFTGGEPFVRQDFLELLQHASRKARTHFISNTTLLTEDRAEAVVALAPKKMGRLGLNFAGTSIEAPGELHDEIRQMPGAFERSMNGVRLLRIYREKAGKSCPAIHVTTVLQTASIDVLHLMPKLLKEAGVDVMNLVTETRIFDVPGFGERDPVSYRRDEVHWPKIERGKLAQALDTTIANAKSAGIEIRLPRMPREALLDYYDQGLHLGQFECRNPWNTLIVGRQGDAYPCWLVKIGNVREHTLKELWNNLTVREFRQTCQKHLFAVCPGCCFLEHKTRRKY